MVTSLLARLLLLAEALSYDVRSDAPIVSLIDEIDRELSVTFNAFTTHEANLRAAIAWCLSYAPQTY